jgi:hypothetical protein
MPRNVCVALVCTANQYTVPTVNANAGETGETFDPTVAQSNNAPAPVNSAFGKFPVVLLYIPMRAWDAAIKVVTSIDIWSTVRPENGING